jgi:hypothetical protein
MLEEACVVTNAALMGQGDTLPSAENELIHFYGEYAEEV